ncbi:MAG: hypothetical protein IT353_11285 [Gemmatimonadaceae bacterium]|nr:hypothetical protein [Gemmatimonadaceae bacterium]
MSLRVVVQTVCVSGLLIPQLLAAQPPSQPPAVSQKRVLVQKERSEGPLIGTGSVTVTTARADSIAQDSIRREAAMRMQRDSIEMRSRLTRDSLAEVERARVAAAEEQRRIDALALARRDSVARAEAQAEVLRLEQLERDRQYRSRGSGFYAGLAVGALVPTGNLKNLGYNSGLNINVPLGWHPQQQLLGVRVDLGYGQFRGRDFSGDLPNGSTLVLNNINPKVLSATGNVTLRVPLTPSKNLNVIALSGVGIYQFRSFGSKTALGAFFGNTITGATPVDFQSVRNKLGAQFGAALEYGVGPVGLYVESRVVNIFANRKDNVEFDDFFGANRGQNLRWVPIMIGVNIR